MCRSYFGFIPNHDISFLIPLPHMSLLPPLSSPLKNRNVLFVFPRSYLPENCDVSVLLKKEAVVHQSKYPERKISDTPGNH